MGVYLEYKYFRSIAAEAQSFVFDTKDQKSVPSRRCLYAQTLTQCRHQRSGLRLAFPDAQNLGFGKQANALSFTRAC